LLDLRILVDTSGRGAPEKSGREWRRDKSGKRRRLRGAGCPLGLRYTISNVLPHGGVFDESN
jgi:hypothetical protein